MPGPKIPYLIPIILQFFFLPSFAQSDSTAIPQDSLLKIKRFYALSQNSLLSDSSRIRQPDTTLTLLHRFLPHQRDWVMPLGLSGQKYLPLTFTLPQQNAGFRFTPFIFPLYQLRSLDSLYINEKHSYSNLGIMIGSAGEQVIRVFHVQNVNKYITLFGEGHKIYNDGGFSSSLADFGSGKAGLLMNYRQIHSSLSISFLKGRIQENGGLKDPPDLATYQGNAFKTLPTNLSDANNLFNAFKAEGSFAYNLIPTSDSIPAKMSLKTGLLLGTESQRQRYTDILNTNDSIQINFMDSAVTHDSIAFHSVYVKPFVSFENKSAGASAGVRYSSFLYHITRQYPKNTNLTAEAEFRKSIGKNAVMLNGSYVISGYNSSDYLFDASFQIPWKSVVLSLKAQTSLLKPFLTDQFYRSNHFIWENDFTQVSSWQTAFHLNIPSRKLFFSYQHLSAHSFVFYDASAKPQQFNDQLTIERFEIRKDFRLGKFGLIVQELLQLPSSEVVRVPLLSSRLNLFLEDYIFKNALKIQTGFDVFYNTAYSPYGYMAPTRVFHMQHDFQTKPYPFINAYLSLKVKTVRAFILVEHLNQGLMGGDYFVMPGYTGPLRSIRLGVNWSFFN